MQKSWMLQEASGVDIETARLVPTEEGPKLLIDRDEYPLRDNCWDVEIFNGKNQCIFIFYWKGEVKLSIQYPPQPNLLFLQDRPAVEQTSTNRVFNWSQVEAFLKMIYQCLTYRSQEVKLA